MDFIVNRVLGCVNLLTLRHSGRNRFHLIILYATPESTRGQHEEHNPERGRGLAGSGAAAGCGGGDDVGRTVSAVVDGLRGARAAG